ncbi:hypothetical protein N0V88_007833 [Collariella sp. IMI 366227]|nr:hypothetical protein N0V88_007833 [Collariella sp. IMI 366227]
MGRNIGYSVFAQNEHWWEPARELYGKPDLTLFSKFEELSLENLYEELPWWRSQIVQILKKSPGLNALRLSLSSETMARYFQDDEDEKYRWFFDRLCDEYHETGAPPLRLRSLYLGGGFLENLHIENSDYWEQGEVLTYNDGTTPIAWASFGPTHCPNLRSLTADNYLPDIHLVVYVSRPDPVALSVLEEVARRFAAAAPSLRYVAVLGDSLVCLYWRVLRSHDDTVDLQLLEGREVRDVELFRFMMWEQSDHGTVPYAQAEVMALALQPAFPSKRRIRTLAVTLLFVLILLKLHTPIKNRSPYLFNWVLEIPYGRGTPMLSLPSEYSQFVEQAVPQSEYCDNRFTPKFLDDFRAHDIDYCAQEPLVSLRCFQGHSRGPEAVDSICLGQGAVLDVARQKIVINCKLRHPDENETTRGIIPFDRIREDWYETGPGWILDHYVTVEPRGSPQAQERTVVHQRPSSPQFMLLIKREGDGNIWHCLMEIWSMMMTFDLLRTTPDPSRDDGGPFFGDRRDFLDAQAVVLDDLDDGKFMDLWTMFTGRPVVRWKDLLRNPEQVRAFSETPRNVIIPLPGAGNPLWQINWDDHECQHAPMLKVFVQRVLRFYGLPLTTKGTRDRLSAKADHRSSPVNVTFINRTGSRKLLDHEALLAALAAEHPHVRIQSVDFAAISFKEQLQLVQATDVLLGVHGAGLMHTIFMHDGPGKAVVEIRPKTNDFRGVRNMAVMKGSSYFTSFAERARHFLYRL